MAIAADGATAGTIVGIKSNADVDAYAVQVGIMTVWLAIGCSVGANADPVTTVVSCSITFSTSVGLTASADVVAGANSSTVGDSDMPPTDAVVTVTGISRFGNNDALPTEAVTTVTSCGTIDASRFMSKAVAEALGDDNDTVGSNDTLPADDVITVMSLGMIDAIRLGTIADADIAAGAETNNDKFSVVPPTEDDTTLEFCGITVAMTCGEIADPVTTVVMGRLIVCGGGTKEDVRTNGAPLRA